MAEITSCNIINLKGSDLTPSLLYNNLTSLDNWVAYVHKNNAVVVNISKPDAPAPSHPVTQAADSKTQTVVYQTKAVVINSIPVLLIVVQGGLMIWDMAKERMLAQCQVENSSEIFLSRGVGILPHNDGALILLGNSNGTIAVLDFKCGNSSCTVAKMLHKHTDNISDIASGTMDDHGFVAASADIAGDLIFWSEHLEVMGTAQDSFSGDTLTSLKVIPSHVVGAFGSGLIRLYNTNGSCAVEIAAHARWINGIDYCPATNRLASVSEDMLLCLWQMPSKKNDGKVALQQYALLKDCLLTGVQFINSNEQVAVTAYDWDKLYVYNV